MTNIVALYIKNLPDSEKVLIIDGFELFERNGSIGDEPLRLHANAFLKENGIPPSHITLWMNQLAFEAYRYFTNKYFSHVGYPPYED